ncbi:MAG: AGE family epimerase/isomerase [Chloroflexi bacterium]|nr:AGE family epimerase/isomerase [Chloroflexota bacterium]
MQPVKSSADDRANAVEHMKSRLGRALRYWGQTCDWKNGGYILADRQRSMAARWGDRIRGRGAPATKEKFVVSQARLLYVFSLAHRKGYRDAHTTYVKEAELGYRFLRDHLLDRDKRAFNWKADLEGRALDGRKFLYGQAMGIYGLVEYYRACGRAAPLEIALKVFQTVDEKMRDAEHMGWFEQADENLKLFEPASATPARDLLGIIGLKSDQVHMHWMEVLTELFDVTRNPLVKERLREALTVCTRYFYLRNLDESRRYCTPDWGRPASAPGDISYGHALEFAWLMLRAQEALEVPLDWDHFTAYLDYCLRFGFDHQNGGFFTSGLPGEPASDTSKVWWVQAEGLVALCDAVRHKESADYAQALDLVLSWIRNRQMLADGVWIERTDAEGNWSDTTKASSWKAGYHEVRAMVKFLDAFSPRRPDAAHSSAGDRTEAR